MILTLEIKKLAILIIIFALLSGCIQTQQSASHKVIYVPSNVSILAGTNVVGNLSDMQEFDGVSYHVGEVASSPGFNYHIKYYNVVSFDNIGFYGTYNGSTSHVVTIELYDTNITTWRTLRRIIGTTQNTNSEFMITKPADFIYPNGTVIMRLYHTTMGNIAHDMNIDQLILEDR